MLPNWAIAVIAGCVGLLQALILFILRDMKAAISELASKELCTEKHKSVNRRLSNLEINAGISVVRNPDSD